MSAELRKPSTKAGRIKTFKLSSPITGSSPNLTEKTRISISANQKSGMDSPETAMAISALSSHEFTLRAERMPKKSPAPT